jgi:tRNA nucleotidyltransferase (CCA-adding enzyme)
MKIYLVGGAVRDKLLGLPIKERDFVVVGASEADMLKLGYQRVGKEFPVFLHPKTREEYALARRERKTGPGYKGFDFDASPAVSLEDDLLRRDLTINAIAEAEDGQLTDPYHGRDDIKNKMLRHVSPAFAEDPVRILRVGRLLARFHHLGFHVAPETITLMRGMVKAGEVDALVAERVWKELERALGEPNPEMFFEVLGECGALPILFPGLDLNGHGIQALKIAGQLTDTTAVRFAALMHDDKYLNEVCKRYKLPNAYHQLAKLTAANYLEAGKIKLRMDAEELLNLFYKLDYFRREERFNDFLLACTAIYKAKNNSTLDTNFLMHAAKAARSYPVQELIDKGVIGQKLAEELKIKRQEKIMEWINKN